MIYQPANGRNHLVLVTLVVMVLLILDFNSSCINGARGLPANETPQEVGRRPKETPVPLEATKENKGKRCEARTYNVPSENRECYRLQERLIKAALDGNLAEIREALRDGAHPDATYYNSFPALHSAAMFGREDAVQLLLDNGADVNLVVSLGNTPLKMAVNEGHTDIVRILIERGADVCDRRQSNNPALQIAEEQGHKEITELLKAAGAEKCK